MQALRREYRISLSQVDREVNWTGALVLSQPPEETPEHLTLRVLARCLLADERLELPVGGWRETGGAELFARDLTGTMAIWVHCGAVEGDLVRKAVQHNRDAALHLVFGGRGERDAFVREAEAWGRPPRGWERLSLWTFDEAVVASLSAHEAPRQRWSVTIVTDHLYVDVDGEAHEGIILRG